jgi:nickel-type superoxide dismutase maturation protease
LFFHFYRVKGESMLPRLREGDLVLAAGWLAGRLRPGDLVVLRHPVYGTLVKQVDQLLPGGAVTVKGTRPVSLDSQEFGPVARADLLGKVIWRIPGEK